MRQGEGRAQNTGTLKLRRADAKPSKAWFKGRPAIFRFAIDGRRKRNVVVQVKRKGSDPAIVRRYVIKGVAPARHPHVDWDGRVDGGKRYARQGAYKFKVRAKHGGAAITKDAAGKPKAGFFKHKFPVRGAHSYGDGLGAGRGHRGVDIFAAAGRRSRPRAPVESSTRPTRAPAPATTSSSTARAPARTTSTCTCSGASPLRAGDQVRTGQRIGLVGESGNAQGCHLHFELWGAPGWYEGGEFVDPVPRMRAWDRWS